MPFFPEADDNAIYFSMFDESSHWCRTSHKPFVLEDVEWPTVEHYFQAMRFSDPEHRMKIRAVESVDQLQKLSKSWFKSKRKDWNQIKVTIMTRGLYMQSQMYADMKESILETGDQRLVENSMYDYFWGCGRDRRGENQYGVVLMNIRAKLLEKN